MIGAPVDASVDLYAALFDDAALFPPARTPLPVAVAAHTTWRSGSTAGLVGPFVCPADRWDELAAERGDFPVAVTVPGAGAIRDLVARAGGRLAQLEVAPASVADVAAAARVVPAGVPVYVEVPVAAATEDRCAALAEAGLGLKLRTGGTSADAFPGEDELARALDAAVRTGVATKLTAGLHHGTRHRDRATGFEHHGFLNVLIAVDAAAAGAGPAACAAALAERDPTRLAERVRRLDESAARAVRRTFRSFGTCSVEEPLADLRALGLLLAGAR